MAPAILIALGLALMCGVEAQHNMVLFAIQGFTGLGLFILGLSIGKHDLTH